MQSKKRRLPSENLEVECDSKVAKYRSIKDGKLQYYFNLYEFQKEHYQKSINHDESTLEGIVDAASKLEMAKQNIVDYVQKTLGTNLENDKSFSIQYAQYYPRPKRSDELLETYDNEIDRIRYLNDSKLRGAITTFDQQRKVYVSKINEVRSSLGNIDPIDIEKARDSLKLAVDAVRKRATEIGIYTAKESSPITNS